MTFIHHIADETINYFVCTLGQAKGLNYGKPHAFKTVNEFIDWQKDRIPDLIAVAFPNLQNRESLIFSEYFLWRVSFRVETDRISRSTQAITFLCL